MTDPAKDILTETVKKNFGIDYLFPYQRLVITNILDSAAGADSGGTQTDDGDGVDTLSRQIVILPTGAGKSLCFMLPAILLEGPTLVIFPLLSLIADQKRRCDEAGIGAASLTGGQSAAERDRIFDGIADGRIRIVLTNPETALSDALLPRLKECGFSHLVFDEVHTVSEWGDSFRPAYLESGRIYREAGIPIVTAFTATASETVLSRVRELLFPDGGAHLISANPDRPNIAYSVIPTICKAGSLEALLSQGSPNAVERPALVFCSTRKTASRTALELRLRLCEKEIFFYHAGLDKEEKKKIEDWFFGSRDGVLLATTAYGMGIDKPDIRTVIHYNLSPSVEAYLQESGRAGRDRQQAEAILLCSPSDRSTFRGAHDPAARARFEALLNFAEDGSTCRRENLLRLLGAEPEACFGCDVCRKAVVGVPEYKTELISLIRRNRRRFPLPEAAAAGSLRFSGLSREDAAEALSQLIRSGDLRKIRRGPWKGKLTTAS